MSKEGKTKENSGEEKQGDPVTKYPGKDRKKQKATSIPGPVTFGRDFRVSGTVCPRERQTDENEGGSNLRKGVFSTLGREGEADQKGKG